MTTEITASQPHAFALPTPLNGVARLTHLGVLQATGEDAAKFLHGQMTNDFVLLGLDEARLCAYCSAKGRVMTSFIGMKQLDPSIILVGSLDLIAAMQKRLSMFVLRAKVKLVDATQAFAVYGLAGDVLDESLPSSALPWSKCDSNGGSTIALYPAGRQPRQLRVQPADAPAPAGPTMTLDVWKWGEVHSGVAHVTAATTEMFVPQMLNYESIGGINFKKGCYPGQEVVARSQFRGTIKRRIYLMRCDALPGVGAEVFDTPEDGSDAQSVGHVVWAAAEPSGGFAALVSAQVASVQAGKVRLGAKSGPLLAPLPLPYSLLDDI